MMQALPSYPGSFFQDLSQLLDASQPASILLLSEGAGDDILAYQERRQTIHLDTHIEHYRVRDVQQGLNCSSQFDLTIVYQLMESLSKTEGEQLLALIRDLLAPRYAIGLPLGADCKWTRNEMFAFGLRQVASYHQQNQEFGLFKYDINSYKQTPQWLNADNWANPHNWGKYRW